MKMTNRFLVHLLGGLLMAHALAPCLWGESREDAAARLAAKLNPLVENHAGQVAVAVKHLTQQVGYRYQADVPFPTASLIKFPLLVATFQAIEAGDIALDDTIELHEGDKVPGSGILTAHFSEGAKLPLRDALRLMIVYSDNTATNLVIEHVGLAKTSALMESLGCPETKLNSKTYSRETSIFPERSTKYGLGSTTADDMVKLLELLQTGKLISANASQQMLALLSACQDRTKIARFLPSDVRVANKTGEVSAARTDAALLQTPSGPIAICVLTAKNEDQRWSEDNPAHVLCGDIGKIVYEHFNSKQTDQGTDARPLLGEGSNGRLVEALQRTLNARSNPSPGLTVDGDFGPATLAALLAFQKVRNLTALGEVTPETWEALGPLLTEDDPVPPPAVVNAEMLEQAPPDPVTGPPFVTCKAWVIGDPQAGHVLSGENQQQRLDPASTTKIMTGYLVAKYATEHPEVLDELVTFSQAADETAGSTSGVRAGERVTVRELLYGLLLPSGNDASVAFAEHFGDRLHPNGEGTSYDRFIAAMNQAAEELGMSQTAYRNTHGLTAVGHLTTAADLFTLASAAMKIPLFAKCVGTRQRGATVTGAEGYTRDLFWKNTNRLLRIDGYQGVKTGTTNAAGCCLVSQVERDGRARIVVVLGATSSDARYVDTRNLFRFAWQQAEAGD